MRFAQECVELDDVTGECETADVEPTRSVGRYFLRSAGDQKESHWAFEGDVQNVFFNEPQAVDAWGRFDPRAPEADGSIEGFFVYSDTPVEAPEPAEPVDAVERDLETFYFVNITRKREVPEGQLRVRLSETVEEQANEAGESDLFVRLRGSCDLTGIDVEQDYSLSTEVEIEEPEECVEVSEGAPTGELRVDVVYTGLYLAPGEYVRMTAPTPSRPVEVKVAPQVWVDATIQERAPEPATQGDVDLRRQIQELRKQLELLERKLDGKGDAGVSSVSREDPCRELVLDPASDLDVVVEPANLEAAVRVWREAVSDR